MSGCQTCDTEGKENCPVHGDVVELAARPHGTRAKYSAEKCRCVPCRDSNARYENLRVLHPTDLVDAEPARQHVRLLRERGIGLRRLAELTGTPRQMLQALMSGIPHRGRGPTKRIRPDFAMRILAVDPLVAEPAPALPVPVVGARRRLQALVAIGWQLKELTRRSGLSRSTISAVLTDDHVRFSTVKAIRDLYEELWNTRPPEQTPHEKFAVARAKSQATRNGWVPPMAWDDDTIDDPDAVPEGAATDRVNQRNKLPAADDLRFLLEGESKQRVAARFGVKPSSIDSALARAS
ncbi:hypothetical protein [Amycolatopsis japonica]